MGQNQSMDLKTLSQYYDYVSNGFDDDYGQISVYQNKANEKDKIAVVKKHVDSKYDIKKQLDQLQYRVQLDNPHGIKIFGSHYAERNEMCGTFNVLHIGVEYVGNTLSLDIIDRRNQRQHSNIVMKKFDHQGNLNDVISSKQDILSQHLSNSSIYRYSESELWYLILSCIEGLLYNNLHNIDYFDLHPTHIRITEDGVIKLMDLCVLDQPLSNALKVQLGLRTLQYLAPEQLTQNKSPNYSMEKVNIFCLGLMCVQCILKIEDPSKLYVNSQFVLPQKELVTYLEKYQFSEEFNDLLSNMLKLNPSQRPSYQDIILVLQQLDPSQIGTCFKPTQGESCSVSKIAQSQIRVEQQQQLQDYHQESSQVRVHEEFQFPTFKQAQGVDQSLIEFKERYKGLQLHDSRQLTGQSQMETFDMTEIDFMIRQSLDKSTDAISRYGGQARVDQNHINQYVNMNEVFNLHKVPMYDSYVDMSTTYAQISSQHGLSSPHGQSSPHQQVSASHQHYVEYTSKHSHSHPTETTTKHNTQPINKQDDKTEVKMKTTQPQPVKNGNNRIQEVMEKAENELRQSQQLTAKLQANYT